ncbi:hypothetical protein [Brevundimonas sp.]|uniref:hypothetical protein n=1 Tax=Brevundimonas sp. TaxID=1871086 RepID=UPI0024874F57|nr:hypothetical protein [Brevundimonas sp.]MDI1282726.1 hypothetical protein [Brevundimonas sp.]
MTVGKTFGTFSRPDNLERIVIVRRDDGLFSYQKQVAERDGAWGSPGPACGLYDSPETTISEAKQRVWWLLAMADPDN